MTLSFESEKEALWARHALSVSKYFPDTFKAFPEFSQYDPTLALPREVRDKAVRLFSKNLMPEESDDVTGMVSSLYSESGKFVGSLVSAAYEVPAAHAFFLYALLSSPAFGVRIHYDSIKERVNVDLLHHGKNMGFWFPCSLTQIQTHDLQQTLKGNGYLGLAFPISANSYDDFFADKAANSQKEMSDDFFAKQVVDNWLTFHLADEKVVRQSAKLAKGKVVKPQAPAPHRSVMTTGEWLTATC